MIYFILYRDSHIETLSFCVSSDDVIAVGASMQRILHSSAVVRNEAEAFDKASISLSDNSGENLCLTMLTSGPFRICSCHFF